MEAQNGFREKKSTATANQSFTEKGYTQLFTSVPILFDLTKAYHVINHNILLNKLNSYGISGIRNLWFKSYLVYQEQFVKINQTDHRNSIQNKYISLSQGNKTLCAARLNSGAPLVLLYKNYLPLNIQGTNLVLFVDGTNLLVTEKDKIALQHKMTL